MRIALDLVGVLVDELLEELEVVVRLVLLADSGLDEPLGLDGVGDSWSHDERALRSWDSSVRSFRKSASRRTSIVPAKSLRSLAGSSSANRAMSPSGTKRAKRSRASPLMFLSMRWSRLTSRFVL